MSNICDNLIQCDNCTLKFNSLDIKSHAELCTGTVPENLMYIIFDRINLGRAGDMEEFFCVSGFVCTLMDEVVDGNHENTVMTVKMIVNTLK